MEGTPGYAHAHKQTGGAHVDDHGDDVTQTRGHGADAYADEYASVTSADDFDYHAEPRADVIVSTADSDDDHVSHGMNTRADVVRVMHLVRRAFRQWKSNCLGDDELLDGKYRCDTHVHIRTNGTQTTWFVHIGKNIPQMR
jgi:hypothetical protein